MAFSAVIPWAERGAATYLPPPQLVAGLAAAWQAEGGASLTRETAELLLAQILIETDWARAMWRFNWGNITAGASWPGAVWLPSWHTLTPTSSERDRDLHAKMLLGKAPRHFRAYNSHEEGSRDYAKLVLSASYAPLLAAAKTGDASVFARAVQTRYCPDCESEQFSQSLVSIRNQIRANGWVAHFPSVPGAIPETVISPTKEPSGWGAAALGVFVIGGVVAGGAAAIAYAKKPGRSAPAIRPRRAPPPERSAFRYERSLRRVGW